MPADRNVLIPFGARGLNMAASPAELNTDELADSLNWQIDRAGALIKRLGMQEWSITAPADILELMQLAISGGTTYILAHCADGHVYWTTDGTAWTSIDSGISTTLRVGWVQYLDKLYYCDGTNTWRQWDGTTLTTFGGMIKGRYCTIWRNRLWVVESTSARTIAWSKAGDPTDFTTYTLNTISFPDDTEITAIAAIENVGSGSDGADGVLVFSKRRIHRIYDDTDNVAGAIIGGANTLVDSGTGCLSRRSIAQVDGRTFFLASSGIYSTDGRSQAREESAKLRPLFATMAWDQAGDFVGISYRGRYLFGYTTTGGAENSLLLECYIDHGRSAGGYPWMAHDLPVRSWVRTATATGDVLYSVDGSTADAGFVRLLFTGGYDVDHEASQNPIRASAKTGALLMGVNSPKRVRRVELFGRGDITVAVSADLSDTAGESQLYPLGVSGRVWGLPDTWGVGIWGPGGKATNKARYFSTKGRFLAFELINSSTDTASADRALGYAGAAVGGAAAYTVVAKITPLDAD